MLIGGKKKKKKELLLQMQILRGELVLPIFFCLLYKIDVEFQFVKDMALRGYSELDQQTYPADTRESDPSTTPPLNSIAMMVVYKQRETISI